MNTTNLMEYHGPFGGSTGYHGHLLDILKSGLQKYIRRGETSKAIRCAIDLDLFYNFEPKAKGIRSNMINRLRIISCEEFCWGNPLLFRQVDNQIELWNKYRLDNRTGGAKAIISLIRILKQVKPVRMISFIRAAQKHGPLYDDILNKYPELYLNLNADNITIDDINLSKEGDHHNMSEFINKFNYYFVNNSDRCIYWAFKIMNIKDKCKRRYRRTGSEYILWEYLLDYLQLDESLIDPIKVLFKWYKNNKSEHWMYLINAIMICLNYGRKNIVNNIESYYPEIIVPNINEDNVIKIVDMHKHTKFEIDDYCLDQHTSKGRSKNRGPIHFAKIGSYVVSENKEVLNEEYKQIYMDLKYLKEGKPIPIVNNSGDISINIKIKMVNDKISYIKSLPIAQVITGKTKKCVYVDSDFVYKGPYNKFEKSYKNNIRFTKALQILEMELNIDNKFKSSLSIQEEIKDNDGKIYLKFKNIGKKVDHKKIAFNRTTKLQKDVLVLPRKIAVNRISDLDNFSSDIKIAVLQHLYFRYLLDIGDSGDHNILLREDNSSKLIAGIDMEDIRTKDQGNSKLSYLFKKIPSKKQINLYSNYIGKIKIFSKDNFTKNIINSLQSLEIDINKILLKINKFK